MPHNRALGSLVLLTLSLCPSVALGQHYTQINLVANTGDADSLREALKEHVKQQIGMWKYPRWIEIVDSLPKTATGKIQRFKLRN